MNRAAAALTWACALSLASAARGEPEVALCGPEHAAWTPSTIALDGAPLDLRFLNDAPAGKHGFLAARGEALVFEDGTTARFWGANLAATAIFRSSDAEIDWHAERIARMGFNLVRLHHHDSSAWLKGGGAVRFGPDNSRELNVVGMAKLDRWIAKLGEQGVYVWLDLHTGRVFHGGDEIPAYDEVARRRLRSGGMGHGFLFVNPRLQELVIEFGEKLLAHRNPHTGLRYRDDPAIAAVLITNEDDVVHHYGNLFAADAKNPWHRARFLEHAERFAARTGLPLERVIETWKPGPSKLLLAELEERFSAKARARLRAAGVRVPIALTSFWNAEPLFALASLASGDFIDVHAYARGNVLANDPRKYGGLIARIGAAQLAGRPVMVSEWNHGEPQQRERSSAALWLASVAALQDWDGLLVYTYAQSRLARVHHSVWNTALDPALASILPAAGVAYRRGDVAAARGRTTLSPSNVDLWERGLLPEKYRALSTLIEQRRVAISLPLTPSLPWLKSTRPPAPSAEAPGDRSFLAPEATSVRSDTGELTRDFAHGFHTIDTPRTQAASGNLAGRDIALSFARVRAENAGAIAFTSLDGLPLDRSEQVLVSVAARACPMAKPPGQYRAEPLGGTAQLASRFDRVLVPLGPRGERAPARTLARDEAGVALPLVFSGPWALLERSAQPAR